MRTVVETADQVRQGARRAEDVLDRSLAVIEANNPTLNAFVALDIDRARKDAADIDRRIACGEDPGPLAGVPFGVKDLEDLAGFVTTHGSLLHANDPPAVRDSILVARLRAAGAVPLGKTATPEFGLDSSTYSRLFGVTRNPWNPGRTPGGSSGGSSAAVASGMVPFATATDGGGSIREPAAFTGLIGLKPSHGRIPQENGFSSFSCKGFLTGTVRDTARLLDVAAGPDDRDRQSLPRPGVCYETAIETTEVSGLRAVYSPDHGYAVVEPEVAAICEAAADQLILAAGLVRLDTVFRPTNVYQHFARIALLGLKADLSRTGVLPHHRNSLAVQTLHLLDKLESMGVTDTWESDQAIRRLSQDVAEFFRDADLLITPATATAPYAAESLIPTTINGQDASHSGVEPFGMLANFCWNPSISIPAGLTSDGLPVGLQVTARRHDDHVLLRLARLFEQACPWSFPSDAEAH